MVPGRERGSQRGADIRDMVRDVAVQTGMNVVQTAFGVKDIREIAQDFLGISVDSLCCAGRTPALSIFLVIIKSITYQNISLSAEGLS